MEIDVKRLKSGIEDYISLNENLIIDDNLLKQNEILKTKDININGEVTNDYEGYYLDLVVKGILVLPCAITLEPVDYPFEIKIQGNYNDLSEEIAKKPQNYENKLDIFPIIWENILMEIPMRVVSKNATPLKEGNGWKFIEGDEENNSSVFDKLNDLL